MPATSRQLLLIGGTPRGAIERERVAKNLRSVHRGFYVDDDEWRSTLQAHLLRGGRTASVSHRAAARLHGLDGLRDYEGFDVTVSINSTFRARPAFRSRTLNEDDVVLIGGIRVTSLERTLVDLGRVSSVNDVEVALESALRGNDPMRPSDWNEGLFAALERRLGSTRAPGSGVLREVIGRRPPGVRPTGSYAETRILQALRLFGCRSLLRQPTFTVVDDLLKRYGTWYPDLYDPVSGVGIEVDGAVAHAKLGQRRRDAGRDNVLGDYVRVRRIVATDVEGEAARDFARNTAASIAQRRRDGWQVNNVNIDVVGNAVSVRRK